MPSSAPQIPAAAITAACDLTGSDAIRAAYPHLLAAFKERLLSDEAVHEITQQIVEGSFGEVLSLPFQTVKDALSDFCVSIDSDGGTDR
jgi:hypothetical protein